MDRRTFLKRAGLTGAGLVVAGSAAAGWRAHDAGLVVPDATPFAPWDAFARAEPGDPRGLVAAAILASNPHNTQPWRFAIGDDAVLLSADTARHLGAFDPFRREMWIGLGCAIGNLDTAAPGLGFATGAPRIVETGPDGAGTIAVPLRPAPGAAPDPLAAFITRRRTDRTGYAATPVDDATLTRIASAAGPVAGARIVTHAADTPAGRAVAEATIAATRAINADAEMSADGHRWFRPDARAIARHRDGVSIPTAGLSPVMSVLGQILPEADLETSGAYWLASTERQMAGTAGFGLLVVDDLDDRAGQIAAGRLWQRLHLALTAEGFAAQPINQLPEMVDRDRQLGRDDGWAARAAEIAGGRATFVWRYGTPTREVPHSARRGVGEVMG